ncbi:MAG: D-glycero-beta-D-manno-heptose 1-phosphate adenylyltransferase [Bacteroidales bacterium]|nr:D-glycero-beta-D-manno-heptose 1-phosphate adenylyltransferase [Bacteroidales bacterium]MDY6347279.1 D-glycero-beta-D-manno-heptose 1-phosphate adenylyltransferase [Bacteroidales bacterium]
MTDFVKHIADKIVGRDFFSREDSPLAGKKVVFTNGCFDVIHFGHVSCLAQARNMGDALVVGLNSDDSVRRLKGSERPVNSQNERAAVLAALTAVDFVTVFDEDTPENLIRIVKPDVLVKGGDYAIDEIAGADFVIQHGGRVSTIPFVEGFSSTSIIKKIRDNE